MFVRHSTVLAQKSSFLTFQGLNKKQATDRTATKENKYLQKQADQDFLDLRKDWFKKYRPDEQPTGPDDGWTTTPGHSEDEYDSDNGMKPRPSARKRARETGREFDSSMQTFRTSTAFDQQK